jgi:hypothetical protein
LKLKKLIISNLMILATNLILSEKHKKQVILVDNLIS